MPLQNGNPGALHGVTFDLLSGYEASPVQPLAGATPLEEGVEYTFSKENGQSYTYSTALPATVRRVQGLKDNPILNSHTHALHSGNFNEVPREEVTFTHSRDNTQEFTVKEALPLTKLRYDNLSENPILYSHTHALHSAYLGGQERDEAIFTFSKDGTQETKVVDALYPTQLRAQNLNEDSVKFSHTHALHSVNFNQVPREDVTFSFSKGGSQEFTIENALPPTVNKHRLLKENPVLYSHTHALHGMAGANPMASGVSYVGGASGDAYEYKTALPPTARRIKQLQDNASNPFLATSTFAQHGRAGIHGSGAGKNFVTDHTKTKDSRPSGGALHGRAAGQLPGGDGLLGEIADTMKNLLFGKKDWPLARFYFYVLIGGKQMAFQGVDGLEGEIGVIDYRDGNSPFFGKERMPGLVSYSRITLKKGMFSNDTGANNFFKGIAQDRQYTKRRSIFIAMLDHNHIPQFIWRYEKTFITKFVPTNLDAEADSDVAIEEMEFVGRAWYTETLLGMAAGAMGAIGGAVSGSLNIGS